MVINMTENQKIICYNSKCGYFKDHFCTKKTLSIFVNGYGKAVCGDDTTL